MKDYKAAVHAMQTGVQLDQTMGSRDGEPKHLRVGVNSCMCDHAALVRLLIARGVITQAQYEQAITEEMNREVERYETRLGLKPGTLA